MTALGLWHGNRNGRRKDSSGYAATGPGDLSISRQHLRQTRSAKTRL